jgi:uncharacterized membrane protein
VLKFIRAKVFKITHRLAGEHTDERIRKETHFEYARVYYLMLVLIVIVSVAQLFVARVAWAFLPAIIGGGGSVLYMLYRYRREGLLYSRSTDERIEDLKVNIKAKAFLYCMYVYIFGALPLLFLPYTLLVGIILTWFIPAGIAAIRIIRRGLYTVENKTIEKKQNKVFRKAVIKSSVGFGIFMALFTELPVIISGEFESALTLVGRIAFSAIRHGVVWGVLFYFAMLGINKVSEKFGKRRLKNAEKLLKTAEEESGDGK